MGQTPSTTARHDNASTRTLHSSSMNSSRPRSFLRRLSRRLQTHPNRRFGRPRSPSSQQGTPVAPSMTSSFQRETLAATHAAAAATGPPPLPPLPFLHVDPQSSNSSFTSTASTTSSSSEISQLISDLVASAVLSSLSVTTQRNNERPNNISTTNAQFIVRGSSFREMLRPIHSSSSSPTPRPLQSQQGYHASSTSQQQSSSTGATITGQHQTVFPIVIIGYRANSTDSPPLTASSAPTPTPTAYATSQRPQTQVISPASPPLMSPVTTSGTHLQRPYSAVSSSMGTLQSNHLSNNSIATHQTFQSTIHVQQQQQQQQHESHDYQEPLLSSSSSASSSGSSTHSAESSTVIGLGDGRGWLVYVMNGPHRRQRQSPSLLHHPLFTQLLSDNSTYEDLLRLTNLLGPARPVTTTQQEINATLPIHSWCDETTKRTMLQDTEQRCLVCLDDFVPNQLVRVLKCRHVFHVECVDRWLVEARNSCPVCRGSVVTPSSD